MPLRVIAELPLRVIAGLPLRVIAGLPHRATSCEHGPVKSALVGLLDVALGFIPGRHPGDRLSCTNPPANARAGHTGVPRYVLDFSTRPTARLLDCSPRIGLKGAPTITEPHRQASAIRFEHVSKQYPGASRPAVADVSLEIEPGRFVVLLGPSGCGKTTLLKMVNRLYEPTSGRILIDGADIAELPAPALRRRIGYVIQQTGLFPHMPVAREHRRRADAARLEQGRTASGSMSCWIWSGCRRPITAALPGAALRRAAAAGWAGAGAGRRARLS